ncbi:hypothetical protein JCM8547_007539 [Rhodosporidiobolus lusitaniae]
MPSSAAPSLENLHTHDLSFSPTDLGALSSAQLALVQFHPEAEGDERVQLSARVEFLRRREEWRRGEVKQVEKLEKVKEEKEEEDVKPVKKGEREEKEVRVMKEVEDISLLDIDDDEEIVIVKREKGKAREDSRPQAKKRKSDGAAELSSSSSRRTKTAKRSSLDSAEAPAPRVRVVPPAPRPLSTAQKVSKLPSFPPHRLQPKTTPFSVRCRRRIPTLRHAGPQTSPTPRRETPHRSSQPRHPLPLFRSSFSTSTASPPVLPPPTFVPKHSATLARDKPFPWLSDFVVDSAPKDEPWQAWDFRPPPVDPEWLPLPPNAAEDPEGVAPSALRNSLTTVRISGLGHRTTWELLFRFLVRGARRMRPRPLAMRDKGAEDGERSFLLAFRYPIDAWSTVFDMRGKQFPDFLDERFYTCATLIVDPEFEPPNPPAGATPEDLILRRNSNQAKEDAVAWKWGELSSETQRAWRTYRSLHTSRRCPPREVLEDNRDSIISQDHHAELSQIRFRASSDANVFNLLAAEMASKKRRFYHEEKKALYLERCRVWTDFAMRPDGQEAYEKGEAPPWPAYPLDEAVKVKVKARMEEKQKREEEKQKREEEQREEEQQRQRRETDALILEAVRSHEQWAKEAKELKEEREKLQEALMKRMDDTFKRTLSAIIGDEAKTLEVDASGYVSHHHLGLYQPRRSFSCRSATSSRFVATTHYRQPHNPRRPHSSLYELFLYLNVSAEAPPRASPQQKTTAQGPAPAPRQFRA